MSDPTPTLTDAVLSDASLARARAIGRYGRHPRAMTRVAAAEAKVAELTAALAAAERELEAAKAADPVIAARHVEAEDARRRDEERIARRRDRGGPVEGPARRASMFGPYDAPG